MNGKKKRAISTVVRSFALVAMTSACFTGLAASSARAESGSTPVTFKIVRAEDGQPVSHCSARIYDYQSGRWFRGNGHIAGGSWKVSLSPGHYQINAAQSPNRPSVFQNFYVGNHPIGVLVELKRSAPADIGLTPVTFKIVRAEDGQPVSHCSARIYDYQSGRWFRGNGHIAGGSWKVSLSPGHYQINAAQSPNRPSVFQNFYVGNHPIGVLVELKRR